MRPDERFSKGTIIIFAQEKKMKKILLMAAIAMALSATASFALGRIEVSTRPQYDQNRADQQRIDQQRIDQQRADQRRVEQMRADRERTDWQRNQWQSDQSTRNNRRQSPQSYERWLQDHQRDYDNRR